MSRGHRACRAATGPAHEDVGMAPGESLMRADDIGLAVERLLGLAPEPTET